MLVDDAQRSYTYEMPDAAAPKTSARRYGGLTPEQRKEQRRERLLASALESFGTRGYAATPIEKLCSDAGVTARHFYEEFEGREAILRCVYDEIIDELHRSIRAALVDDDGDAEQRVARAVRSVFEVLLADPRKARIVTVEIVGVSPALEEHRRLGALSLARMLAMAIPLLRQDVRPGSRMLDTVSVVLVGGVKELVVEWLHAEQRASAEQLAGELHRIFVALVRGYRA